MAEVKKYNTEFAGKPLMVEIGRLGGQANGTVLVQYGETSVMVNATMSAAEKAVDYLPLQVEYEEKYYAAGKINSSKWIKREGRPSEGAILAGRLIDRPLRPRFNNKIRNEIQVVATVLSFDSINDPDIPAMFGASLALGISDIPFDGPIAGVRMGRVGGNLIINPTYEERVTSDFDIVVAGTDSRINMIEAGAQIIPEAEVASAIKAGFESLQGLIDFQKKIVSEVGKPKKQLNLVGHDTTLSEEVRQQTEDKLRIALYVPGKGKDELYEGIGQVKTELMEYSARNTQPI
jgi:polyribonucleotide nucleotidyltransferase